MGALPIAGTRPTGIYTAGQMQYLMNIEHHFPKGPVVILGSGDLGLIMAEHLAHASLSVTIIEKAATCGGMQKNQAVIKTYGLSLICNTTIAEVLGEKHIEGVTLENGEILPCSTLLIAVGMTPNHELIQHLDAPDWLHLCGNCNQVHPMVSSVINEGTMAGRAAYEKTR